jgi:hypothetical protein
MGGGGSKSAPTPPKIVQDPYPLGSPGLTNLSLSPGIQNACGNCLIQIDARATSSSIKLTRDFGNVSDVECQRYQTDLERVRNNELSFRDFFVNLQAGRYSRPISKNERGQAYCAQVMFNEKDAAEVTDLDKFDAKIASLKNIRIRQVTGGGSFSSGTKAKFRLSIPIRAKVSMAATREWRQVQRNANLGGKWVSTVVPSRPVMRPVTTDIRISMLTMYHPSPIRIENVQHDAILSLNDPSDPTADAVILIPLKSSNLGEESVGFFNKIAKHLTTITNPDSVTSLYPETDVPTGNDWNIKSLFWLADSDEKSELSTVTDGYFTWLGAGTYERVLSSKSDAEIRYGWRPSGRQVRYFMLKEPVAISPTDLSFLTRSLPPTPPDEAIHKIPDPAVSPNPKILFKRAVGPALAAKCSNNPTRERMTNPGPGDIASSILTGGGMEDLLVDDKGNPLSDKNSCDPFAMNAKNALANPSPFTPTKMAAYFFNVLILFAVAFGTWIALYFVVTKDYDYSYRDFSNDAGKVVAIFAGKQAKGLSMPGVPSLQGMLKGAVPGVGNLQGMLKEATAPPLSDISNVQLDTSNLPPQLSKLSGLLGKKV